MRKLKKKDIRPILYKYGLGYMLDEDMELFNEIGKIYHNKQLINKDMNKINIYSIDMFDNYNYEFTTITNNNCSQTIINIINSSNLTSKVDEYKKNYVWFDKLINHNIFKHTNIIGLKASYK
jgi:hypothetical protein